MIASAHGANVEEGKARASACAACHGSDGVSVNPTIPNLAGQKEAYLINQLKAFKAGARKNAMMNAVAAQLSDQDIENLAAFWNSLPGAAGMAKSEVPAHILKTRVAFPENYRKDFTYYTSINFPDRKQVRRYYANRLALQAARDGRPLPQGSVLFVEVYGVKLDEAKNPITGADGFYVPEKLLFYTAMETQPGWGDDFPELFRNGDWNYAVFTTDKKPRAGVNQAECLACHKPLAKDSYVFSLEALRAQAKTSR
jgi:cytochrome c553